MTQDRDGTWEERPRNAQGIAVRVLTKPSEGFLAGVNPIGDLRELRRAEYPPTDEMVVALWEHVVEGRPEAAQDLQAVRAAVKNQFPDTTRSPETQSIWKKMRRFFKAD